ncbi:MAG: PLP-dependent aminotransferase family protein [Candidatus Hydrogenedentota bacterium]|uniref:Aromatic-amino-acid aminotransferase n=1 Tax=Sumerlaea chitinivorans TaxID=2250252 RepID=A0A2Z4YA11_SUMC1|nr:Aromatic-amino-acid aminotransferase [Candidatus Sumerlaea chitinivorans]RMH31185.1 MAG: PLP-dependent aminotransferase family protein [Candidatus Hydrogenedentota bacterium]GIX43885.1 MAG: aminotransferase [Candidatus Sumerlaea sp.]
MSTLSERRSRLAARALRTTEPAISWLLKKPLENPAIISLAAGLVDQQTLPAQPMREIFAQLFADEDAAKRALQYGTTEGEAHLRQLLAQRLAKGGMTGAIDPEHIVLTNGSQQLLLLVTDVLVDPGDIVLVEDPTYFVYMGVLESAGARTLGVATDDEGIIPEALEERLREIAARGELERLKLLYVMTYYQNPKGTSHSWQRRQQIYELIERYSSDDHYIYILEDAAYHGLHFEDSDVPFMKSLDEANERVILAMTFSKAFAPGLRLGYGYLPPELAQPVLNLKGNHDFGSANLSQHLIRVALSTGAFDRHNAMLRERYRQKRDLMLRVLREEFPPEVQYIEPRGGLYVWVTLPEGVSSSPGSKFFDEAMAHEVLYVPGCFCYAQEPGRVKPDNQLRLCYAYIEEEPMVEGMHRLAEAARACLK